MTITTYDYPVFESTDFELFLELEFEWVEPDYGGPYTPGHWSLQSIRPYTIECVISTVPGKLTTDPYSERYKRELVTTYIEGPVPDYLRKIAETFDPAELDHPGRDD